MQALKDLPQIEAITESTFPFVVPAGSGFYPYLDFLAFSSADDAALTTIDRPRILDGRLPRPDAVDEAAVLDLYADEAGLQVGDEIELESFHPDQLEPLFTTGDAGPPAGPRVTVRVTGIVAAPTFLSESVGSFVPRLFLTPAFGDAHADDMAVYPGGFTARLRNGADDGRRRRGGRPRDLRRRGRPRDHPLVGGRRAHPGEHRRDRRRPARHRPPRRRGRPGGDRAGVRPPRVARPRRASATSRRSG